MKKYFILLLLFTCTFSFVKAQNWKTVALHDTTYFYGGPCNSEYYSLTPDSNLLRVIWINTVTTVNGDSSFYFFKGIRLTTSYALQQTANDCIDTAANAWLGEKLVRKNDGTEYYFNSYFDTITIRTMANLSDSWLIAKDTFGNSYVGTVSAVDTQTIDGAADSVKTITIQAYQGSNPIPSHYNSLVFQLSKQHGWIKTLDLYRFPNTNTLSTALGTVADSSQHYRLPERFKYLDYNKIDLHTKYAVGNEWIYKREYNVDPYKGAWKTIIHDSVTAVSFVSQDTAIVSFLTKKYVLNYILTQTGYVPDAGATTTFHTDTISSHVPPKLIINNILPDNKDTSMAYYLTYGAGQTRYFVDKFCGDIKLLKFEWLLHGAYIHNTGGCWLISPTLSGYALGRAYTVIGFGNIYSLTESGEVSPLMYNKVEYTYIKLGTCVQGTKTDVLTADIDDATQQRSDGFNIYPNPATNHVTVSTNQQLQNASVSLYDITGRLLIKQSYPNANLTISTKDLSNGVYIIQLETHTAKFTKKLIVKK